jgi:hypothetical protein
MSGLEEFAYFRPSNEGLLSSLTVEPTVFYRASFFTTKGFNFQSFGWETAKGHEVLGAELAKYSEFNNPSPLNYCKYWRTDILQMFPCNTRPVKIK